MGGSVLMTGRVWANPHKLRCPECRGSRLRCYRGVWTCTACAHTFVVRNGRIEPIEKNPGDDATRSFVEEPIQNYQGDDMK